MARKIMVGMSGGVDSSVAAYLLKKQGYEVTGVTFKLWDDPTLESGCCSADDVRDAAYVCQQLGIPHYVLNYKDLFRQEVVGPFAEEYLRGRTPNPCISCNRYIKFGAFSHKLRELGFDLMATGHYARCSYNEATGRWELKRAIHPEKDQSYVLYNLTQEQLAEALGMTPGAVYKWEAGLSQPELAVIVELADLFQVSMDVLVGYELRNNDRESVIERLKQYVHDRDPDHGSDPVDAISDVEKALQRYPNCFEIVYRSARIYRVKGLYLKNPAYSERAISLYRHACLLIGQNTDPEISEVSIHLEMAQVYISLGQTEKGLDILKKNNPCRLNHPKIGEVLASSCNDAKGALPYLSAALLDLTVTHMQIVMGYLNLYCKQRDYENALLLLDWALAFYPGLKCPQKRSYLDKSEAALWAVRADVLWRLEQKEDAADSLRKAKVAATAFDREPNYDARNIRFVSAAEAATAYDDMGSTAMDVIDTILADSDEPMLLTRWMRIQNEE